MAWGHSTPDRQLPEGSVNSSATSSLMLSVGAGFKSPRPFRVTYNLLKRHHQLGDQGFNPHDLVGDISHSNQSRGGSCGTLRLGWGHVRSILRAKEQNMSITTYESSPGALAQEASIKEDPHIGEATWLRKEGAQRTRKQYHQSCLSWWLCEPLSPYLYPFLLLFNWGSEGSHQGSNLGPCAGYISSLPLNYILRPIFTFYFEIVSASYPGLELGILLPKPSWWLGFQA